MRHIVFLRSNLGDFYVQGVYDNLGDAKARKSELELIDWPKRNGYPKETYTIWIESYRPNVALMTNFEANL
jgi:hypothetical protein